MKRDRPSLTAHQTAIMRAAHQLLDNPIIFKDPIALSIIGTQGASDIHSRKRKFNTRLSCYLRAIVVARSKFVEEELSLAIKRGVRQYVILGAGLDTFAYRNQYSVDGLKVFEVDYPATQAWKRQQLNAAKIPIPKSLTFTPIDFEKQTLENRLLKVGFKTNEPSFFSWLGVTMYLTRETMMTTLKYISSSTPADSQIVFDYIISPSSQNIIRRLGFRLLAHRLAVIGEPLQNFFDPNLLVKDLKTIGFTQVEDIGPKDINTRFFNNRADKLRVGVFGHLMKAQL
ncbi:MAG: class I SAM-dependent methyltransferase [Desulfobacteraceae bacterium]|nr:class I SAM-dependent methyltransferase [Desulfobacteraceae bacterium]